MMLPNNPLQTIRRDGFIVIDVADSTWKAVTATFDEARRFFGGSMQRKIASSLPDECGYRPMGKEYSQSASHPDQIESFSVTLRNPIDVNRLEMIEASSLYKQMIEVMSFLELIAEDVTIRLATAICGQDLSARFQGAFHRWSRLQVNNAFLNQDKDVFIHEPHEDGNLITIACATASGLEIRSTTGDYVPINLEPRQFLLMPGDILWLLSGGTIQPLWHRVRPTSANAERLALLFFGDIDPAVCQPWIQNESNSNVDISERIRDSVRRYGLAGFESD